ncbi:MAG TPA: cupin domain-containing protein [Candidatus Saccharimonadales bacterium]|nr:cupin domain-containing protein [Candidatus Saccharimonadales bacterium]
MYKKIVGTATIGIIGISLYYGVAFSTPPSGQTTISVVTATFEQLNVKKSGEARVTVKTHEDVDIVSANLTLAPGGTTGWHSHPGPVFVIVKKGPLTVYNAPQCEPEVYQTGEGFVEKSPTQVHAVRNESAEEAELVTTFIIPVASPRRTDEPQPSGSNCPIL